MFFEIDLDKCKPCTYQQDYYMYRAAKIALKSNCNIHRHGAIAVNRKTGEIVAEGFNHYTNFLTKTYTCHSEIDVINKIKKKYSKDRIQMLDLYVVRIGSTEMIRKHSKPCYDCTNAILKSGIKRVYFSTDENYSKLTNTPDNYIITTKHVKAK